ncbi:hypothetical protein B4589_004725 [Halolamina sp. CBA1230]|nr:hypothetical protein B4589_004725 [Halolamina sp. CBA1230]
MSEVGDFLKEASDVRGYTPELDLVVLPEADVSVMPAEIVVIVSVVEAQYLFLFRVVVLEPVEPPTRVFVIGDSEHFHATARDRAV